ncbi:hypothetical protein SAMN05444851_1222 [Aliiroseovarius sediminilitoris]|uniref:Transposase n=1 Tax=Aliiroseovarius sediminilitoris TaxID=1173584 RepID=A0A1I0NZ04_9RHOB|nr:hypothetical protein SAMN05444851_1222 [Aliiroseovarius sediminilitoris]
MQLLAIDLGKQSFHVHGITDEGEVMSKKVSRSKLEAAVQKLSPETVAMEACASAHHWGRRFQALGYGVRLVHPRFVTLFVNRNDRHARWAQDLLARAGHNKTLAAIANKTARIAWAVLRSGESYKTVYGQPGSSASKNAG